MMAPLPIRAYTVTTALGAGLAAQIEALRAGRTGLRQAPFEDCDLPCWTGAVDGLETPLTGAFAEWDCRNNRLASLSLDQDRFRQAVATAVGEVGADRIGVFVGTSTSGVLSTEHAYRQVEGDPPHLPDRFIHRTTHNPQAAAEFVRLQLGLQSVAMAICTACSSSAKVFAAAQRAIAAGICDAAVVGGVDSLCQTTLYGFNSLQLVSTDICRPGDIDRAGLSIGEAGGFALLMPNDHQASLAVLGYGESSDAYHMSTPDPAGRGAARAMRDAMLRGGVAADGIDYVNLHGTGTKANDAAEDAALVDVLGTEVAASSTKGFTGHTLGAAGIVEAAFSLLAIEHGYCPPSLTLQTPDPALRGKLLKQGLEKPVRAVLSNSFGFGGNNASLLFGSRA